jgi:hypothetical protein
VWALVITLDLTAKNIVSDFAIPEATDGIPCPSPAHAYTLVEPANSKPRCFKSLLMASDSRCPRHNASFGLPRDPRMNTNRHQRLPFVFIRVNSWIIFGLKVPLRVPSCSFVDHPWLKGSPSCSFVSIRGSSIQPKFADCKVRSYNWPQ